MRYKVEIDLTGTEDYNAVFYYDDPEAAFAMAHEIIKQGYCVRMCIEFSEDE